MEAAAGPMRSVSKALLKTSSNAIWKISQSREITHLCIKLQIPPKTTRFQFTNSPFLTIIFGTYLEKMLK